MVRMEWPIGDLCAELLQCFRGQEGKKSPPDPWHLVSYLLTIEAAAALDLATTASGKGT